MVSVRLPKDLEKQLQKIAKATNTTLSFNIREAVRLHIEELADICEGLRRTGDKNAKHLTTGELKQKLGL
jgi:predicted DNA-binding protein